MTASESSIRVREYLTVRTAARDPRLPAAIHSYNGVALQASDLLALADAVDTAGEVAALDPHVWYDIGPALTCNEANVLAAFLDALGADGAGLLGAHTDGDEEGDEHWTG